MPTHKSEDYKLSAVEYYLTEDKSQEEVCKIFKCSARSLMRWVDKYNEEGEIKRHNRKPVAYKVHKDQVKFILDEIKKNKTITMQDLLEKLKEKYPTLTLSRFHLNRIVNFMFIVYYNNYENGYYKIYRSIISKSCSFQYSFFPFGNGRMIINGNFFSFNSCSAII